MDPEEVYQEMKNAAGMVINADDEWMAADNGLKLAEAFQALDEWLSKGGFLPRAWVNSA